MSDKAKAFTPEEFILAMGLLVRRLRADAPPELRDFSWTQKAVLARLATVPATAAELARAEGVKPQSMSTAIAFLQARKLVEKKPHPADRRQIQVRLTPKGLALRKRLKEAKETWLAQAFAKLDKPELTLLAQTTGLIKRMLKS